MANSIGQDCVVSLTIPMDSIKSSCNTDERILRKMQALEAKLERMNKKVEGLAVRMPQVTSQIGGNQETMRRLERNQQHISKNWITKFLNWNLSCQN